ncbi:MAG TPA: FHA domain-containing protein, partial [Mycobacterium sp.]
MNRPVQPVLTVRSNRSQGSFAPGSDVVVGSDLRADLRVAHPLIARAHLLLRFDQGRWIAVDNNSLNGVFANGQRVPMLDIHDGQSINIGKPDGPRITFEVGHHQGNVGSLPLTTESIPTIVPPGGPSPGAARSPASRPQPAPPRQPPPPAQAPPARLYRPGAPQPVPIVPPKTPTRAVPSPAAQSGPASELDPPTRMGAGSDMLQAPTRTINSLGPESAAPVPGAARIGRAIDNDIVIHDVLASRYHAFLA